MPFFTYILECSDGSYYVGHAVNTDRRFGRHVDGSGAQHTTVHPPKRVVYSEQFDTEQKAIARERQIKKWTRAKKKALINGDTAALRDLSKSHDHKRS